MEGMMQEHDELQLQEAAEAGDPEASYQLADLVRKQGRHEEYEQWMRRAAEAGHYYALQALIHKTSERARSDPEAEIWAEHWYRRWDKLDAESRPAWYAQKHAPLVALAERMPEWVSRRTEEAERILLDLAEKGSSDAAGSLAVKKQEKKEYKAAAEWFIRSHGSSSRTFLAQLKRDEGHQTAYTRLAREGFEPAKEVLRHLGTPSLRPPQAPGPGTTDVIVTAILTAAILPFIQTIASKAAESSYYATRNLILNLMHRGGNIQIERSAGRSAEICIIRDPKNGVTFEMKDDQFLSDEALDKLIETDLESLAAPDPSGKPVTIRWDDSKYMWVRHVK
jgi:hypothetical protein